MILEAEEAPNMRRLLRSLIVGSVIVAIVRRVVARRTNASAQAGSTIRGAPLRSLRTVTARLGNPIVVRLGLAGGRRSPLALIEHVGRTSGRVYRTPIAPLPMDGGFEIPLPYGTDVHWVRNVLAAGRARLQVRDTIYELDRPEVVSGADAMSLALPVRRVAGERGWEYLRVHTVARTPGTFSHLDGHPAHVTHGEPVPVVAEGPFGEFLAPVGAGDEVPAEPKMTDRAPMVPEASGEVILPS
jgi:deazaflavin-dependent oxidoreductase (nitroreductase family)